MLLLKSLPSFLQLHILLVLLPFDGSFPCSLSPATPKYRDHSRMGLCHFPSATSRILQASSFILRVIMPSVPRVGLVVKSLLANAGDTRDEGLIPGLGRSPGEGHSNSSVLACRTLWTAEPGGRQSIGLQRVRHDWSNLAHTYSHTPPSDGIL